MADQSRTLSQILTDCADQQAELSQFILESMEVSAETANWAEAEAWVDKTVFDPAATSGLQLSWTTAEDEDFLLLIPAEIAPATWLIDPQGDECQGFTTSVADLLSLPARNLQGCLLGASENLFANWNLIECSSRVRIVLHAGEDEAGSLWMCGPLQRIAEIQAKEPTTADQQAASANQDKHGKIEPEQAGSTSSGKNSSHDLVNRIRRVLPLDVTVSVRLAEKKIEMSQLVNMSPGTLISFQKSCDDLLDLYVNNQFYAQGEAVKIGEKFGLKINDVGVIKERPPGVYTL